jgi:outer membrane protein TolC
VQQNKALRQSAAMDAQAVLYNLSLNVIQYYYQALMAQEVIVIAQRQLAQSQKLYTAVKKQIDAGLMTTRDLLNMESQVSQKETDLFQSETQLKQAYNNLKQLLNISSNEPIKLKTVSLNSLQIQPNILDSNFNLPQLKSLEFQLLAADQSIEMAAAAKYPVLSLSAGLTTRSSNLIQLELGQQFSNNLSKTIAFSLRVPLFNKFQNDMNIRNAQLNKQLLALQVKSFKNQQYNKQRNLVLDVENDRKNLDNLAKQQNYLDKELAFAEKSFQLGTSTYNEYFQVQTRNQNVQIDRLKAQINLQYKLLLFDTYQGSK